MRAPVVTQQVRAHASKLDAVSDEIDAVNVLKGSSAWDAASEFDQGKNKAEFRQYDAACDRVRAFYAVSSLRHGLRKCSSLTAAGAAREADAGVQRLRARGALRPPEGQDDGVGCARAAGRARG